MPVTPYYANKMLHIGCSSGGSGDSSKLEELRKQLEKQEKQIDALKSDQSKNNEEMKKLTESLVEVSDFGGNASFLVIDGKYQQ